MKEIIDNDKLLRTVRRMSHEIIERNNNLSNIILLGVLKNGVPLAKMIRDNILKFEEIDIPLYELDITGYRDDIKVEEYQKLHIDISNKYGHNKGTKKVILDSLKPYRADVYYNVLSQNYHIAGIKYANYKYVNGHYMIDKEQYDSILKQEKILTDEETYTDLEAKGIEFLFSLYKNDIISYEKNGDFFTERFLSRTMPKNLNYIETKPLEKNNFPKRNLIGLSKSKQITKINTDILGNMHFTNKEKFKLY